MGGLYLSLPTRWLRNLADENLPSMQAETQPAKHCNFMPSMLRCVWARLATLFHASLRFSLQITPDGGVTFSYSASVSNLFGQPGLLSPPEPFRRSHFRDSARQSRQSKRFNSADDVFRASLLRHSLPAKPPR